MVQSPARPDLLPGRDGPPWLAPLGAERRATQAAWLTLPFASPTERMLMLAWRRTRLAIGENVTPIASTSPPAATVISGRRSDLPRGSVFRDYLPVERCAVPR